MNRLQNIFTDSRRLNLLIWIIISIGLLVYKLNFHELWKDEWQAWMVSRDLSIVDMLSFLNYEGHPSLWYLYLKLWTLLPIQEDIALQVAHIFLIIISTYILFIRLNLPTLWKALIAFSYFFIFEYGVVNRGYALVILLSLLAVDIICRYKSSWLLGLILFLLCQTEVYGVIIAGAITLYILLSDKELKLVFNKKIILWSVSGFLLFVLTVYPRGNEDDFSRAYNQQTLSSEVIHESIQGHLANVFAIGVIDDTASSGNSILGLFISLILVILLVWLFIRDRRSLVTFIFGLLVFILFGIFIFTGGIRQWGMVYLLFILILILSFFRNKKFTSSRYLIATLLMIAPVIHGLKALKVDASIPFSNAKKTGLFIKEKVPENVPVVVINKFETAPVGAYAERPLYELPSGEKFTFFKWLEKVYIPTQNELILFTEFKRVGGIVLLSPEPIDLKRFPNAVLWQEFSKENFKRENYWLYSMPLSK